MHPMIRVILSFYRVLTYEFYIIPQIWNNHSTFVKNIYHIRGIYVSQLWNDKWNIAFNGVLIKIKGDVATHLLLFITDGYFLFFFDGLVYHFNLLLNQGTLNSNSVIYLSHINHSSSHSQMLDAVEKIQFPLKTIVAYDGMKILE